MSTTTGVRPPAEPQDIAFDPSLRAGAVLEHVLEAEAVNQTKSSLVSVDEALTSQRILKQQTGRTKSRVLFVTTDETVLVPDSTKSAEYNTLTEQFDEVHIMVLVAREGKHTTERRGPHCWVYPVYHRRWWRLPWIATDEAYKALTFNGAVRPDIVVGTDPFESGLAAYFIAREFSRPVQVHIHGDWLTPQWLLEDTANKWRRRMARYVLKRVMSVRTTTEQLKHTVMQSFPKLADVRTLPQFYNFSGLQAATTTTDIHDTYTQFSFVFLAFGPLTANSHLHDTFAALRSALMNQQIGLVVVGKGLAKQLFIEKTDVLGITKNVVFLEEPKDEISLLKTADVLIATSTSADGERDVLRAAAAGLPLIAYETELRKDLFKDGEAAFLVPPGDVVLLSQKITKLLNNESLRIQFSRNSRDIAAERLVEDPDQYYQAVRDTIEVVLVPPQDDAIASDVEQPQDEENITTHNPNS